MEYTSTLETGAIETELSVHHQGNNSTGHQQRLCPRHRHHSHCLTLVVVVLLTCCVQTTFPCPRDCFCEPHSRNVHCTNKGLMTIPEGIPEDTVELILNQNTFLNPDLTRRNFTGLVKLQKLYMSRCGIATIAVDTFADLTDLVWLDISGNMITFIADHTFRGLHLKHLFINDNQGVQLSERAFEGMSTQGLYMHNSGMSKLPVEVMSPLNGTLRTLWLYENRFETLSEEWLHLFNTLGHLRLGKNPFHCNCEIGWLHKFFHKHLSVFSGGDLPTCATPAPVRGKRFTNLTVDDFRCDLPTFRNVDAVFEQQMGRLTCQARGDPTPTLYWIRPDGTTEIYSPASEDEDQNEGVLYMANVKLTDSTRYKCVASNPAGNVTFSLNVVWPVPPTPSEPDVDVDVPPGFAGPVRKGNVIVAESDSDAAVTPRPSVEGRELRDEAVDDLGDRAPYEWGINTAEKKELSDREEVQASGSSGGGGGSSGGSDRSSEVLPVRDLDARFTIVDLVGAVVGTFFLTLIVCVAVAQLCWRRRERIRRQEDGHYSVPDCSKPPRPPPLVPPARLYFMGDSDGENRVRMLGHHHHGHSEYPS